MFTCTALALALSLTQKVSTPASTPELLDSRWIRGIGNVELSTPGGRRLTVGIRDEAGAASTRGLELDLLDPDAVVVEAHSASFIAKEGMVIGLAVQTGTTTSYHSLLIHKLADQPGSARTNATAPPAGENHWRLTKPIFTSTGDRYRIIDVHNPVSDSIEITFRRGYVDPRGRDGNPHVDEKLYVNVCPGSEDPMVAGSLFDLSVAGSGR